MCLLLQKITIAYKLKCFRYMFKQVRKYSVLLACAAAIYSCQQPTPAQQYEALERKEISSGKRVDSVFYGLYFGMNSKDFFTYCWEMSKKGIFTDGENNQFVLHKLENGELKHKADMNFYPDFYQGKIFQMRVKYQYQAWAPWNKNLFADSLLTDVLQMYQKDFPGNPFFTIQKKGRQALHIKIDGNRRITIGTFNDAVVNAVFTDVNVEKQIETNGSSK